MIVGIVLGLLAAVLTSACGADAAGAAQRAARADGSSFPLGDPDTVRAEDGRYVTYGTTVPAGRGERCGRKGRGTLFVPVLKHGSGSTVGNADCASRDALPTGPGGWAEPRTAIWAPGVTRFKGRYLMFYTATRQGTGRKCIGRAVSRSAYGPFHDRGVFACPASRWAIDANPFVHDGTLWVAYRDDAVVSGAETAISVVRADKRGKPMWTSRRTLLTSTDVIWDTKKNGHRNHIVENPSLFTFSGRWYLAFSGNRWASARYATGLADCGPASANPRRCRPVKGGASRPYFGYVGKGGIGPYRGLPGNHRGPGAMDVYAAADGTLRVAWHWFDGRLRHPVTGTLTRGKGGFRVS